jgi:hypothetical protein
MQAGLLWKCLFCFQAMEFMPSYIFLSFLFRSVFWSFVSIFQSEEKLSFTFDKKIYIIERRRLFFFEFSIVVVVVVVVVTVGRFGSIQLLPLLNALCFQCFQC